MSKNTAYLVLPSTEYKESFIAALAEMQNDTTAHEYSEQNLDLTKLAIETNFKKYVEQLRKEAEGMDLPEGYVAHTTYWLIDKDENDQAFFVGRLDIRHQLNDFLTRVGGHIGYMIRPSLRRQGYGTKILELGLEKAREILPVADLASSRVLLTCNTDNLGSQKIIENNAGQFSDITPAGNNYPAKRRYWIKL